MKCGLVRSSAGAFEIRYGNPGANNARNNNPDWIVNASSARIERTLKLRGFVGRGRWLELSLRWNIQVNPSSILSSSSFTGTDGELPPSIDSQMRQSFQIQPSGVDG